MSAFPCIGSGLELSRGSEACPVSSSRSSGPAGNPVQTPVGFVERFRKWLDECAGLEALEGFSLREMFSEVLKRRPADEVDDYFMVGSRGSTPSINDVSTTWPKPWFFARVLLFISVLYLSQLFVLMQFGNVLVLPGMMMTGSLAVPLATAFLFFELNTLRNVSFHRS